jgi:hypothetical protein
MSLARQARASNECGVFVMLVACAQVTWQRTPFIPNDPADLTVSLRPVRYVLGFALGMRVPITARDGDRDCQVLITALTCHNESELQTLADITDEKAGKR